MDIRTDVLRTVGRSSRAAPSSGMAGAGALRVVTSLPKTWHLPACPGPRPACPRPRPVTSGLFHSKDSDFRLRLSTFRARQPFLCPRGDSCVPCKGGGSASFSGRFSFRVARGHLLCEERALRCVTCAPVLLGQSLPVPPRGRRASRFLRTCTCPPPRPPAALRERGQIRF